MRVQWTADHAASYPILTLVKFDELHARPDFLEIVLP